MDELAKKMMSLNGNIVETLSELSAFKPKFFHALFRGEITKYSETLSKYRTQLVELESALQSQTRVPSNYNEVQIVSGQMSIVFSVRNMTLTSLDEAQKMLSSHESISGFKLSTFLALFAILVSLLSIL